MGGTLLKVLGPLKAPIFALLNAFIKSRLGKKFEDIARIGESLTDLIEEQVIAAQITSGSGADKHKMVADKIIAIIKEKDGIELPEWALDFLQEYLDDLIRAAVEKAKASGLFPS